ncbi:hypothetical protein M2418_001803 [Rhizobium sp. BIGb0125]|jgi:hypothetical protein|uniref:DUF6161 domain-containing protein n=1 Tax=Rhizobium sp. BIGb0125 TaxID=2940618 RepID=UPI0021695D6F|nr:DUF6161 domain-containing protein [Rhizobium sp. BIGb0125]MCS4242277.1 hypothetical protein [Rhizobium sp. BIGb0125]
MNVEQFKHDVVQILSNKEKIREQGKDTLDEVANFFEQRQLYEELISTALMIVFRNEDIDNVIRSIQDRLFNKDQNHIKNSKIGTTTDITMPSLNRSDVESFFSSVNIAAQENSPEEMDSIGSFLIAAIGFEVSRVPTLDFRVDINNNAAYLTYTMEYLYYKSEISNFEKQINPLNNILKDIRKNLLDANTELKSQRETHSNSISELRTEIVQAQRSIETTEEKQKKALKNAQLISGQVRQQIENLQFDLTKELENHKTTVEERLKLKHVTQRWQDVKRRAKLTLIGAGVFIIFLMLAAFLILIFKGQAIIDFLIPLNIKTLVLQSSPAGAIGLQLARIGIVAVPLVSYFWTLKIAVRILMRSLVIMDDADQRATIMDSYYSLTGDGMTDERALPMMLWAIFRPVPGHGPDGIEPPDFTEAINAGLHGKIMGAKS